MNQKKDLEKDSKQELIIWHNQNYYIQKKLS